MVGGVKHFGKFVRISKDNLPKSLKCHLEMMNSCNILIVSLFKESSFKNEVLKMKIFPV